MHFFHSHISRKSIELVTKVLESSFVSAGSVAESFESSLRDSLGFVGPVTVNSGTSALHLALAVAGVKPGDDVILPPQTFIATGLVILMQGAVPVFADIQYETGNIDVQSIHGKITEKTKAIIPVHWGGYPCDLEEINQIAGQHGIPVIEDAAHALGATYKGRPVGSISRFTAFSFQAIKHLTTGDGGALCCLDENDYHAAKRRRWFDIDRENSKTSILGEREYNATHVGYKYHLNDIAAAIGLGNLEEFPNRLKLRRDIARRYREGLDTIPGVTFLNYKPDRESAYWLFTVLVESREGFIRAMKERGVPTSVVHMRIDRNSVFGDTSPDLPNQARFNDRQVSIPIHSGLSDEDVERVINAVKSGW